MARALPERLVIDRTHFGGTYNGYELANLARDGARFWEQAQNRLLHIMRNDTRTEWSFPRVVEMFLEFDNGLYYPFRFDCPVFRMDRERLTAAEFDVDIQRGIEERLRVDARGRVENNSQAVYGGFQGPGDVHEWSDTANAILEKCAITPTHVRLETIYAPERDPVRKAETDKIDAVNPQALAGDLVSGLCPDILKQVATFLLSREEDSYFDPDSDAFLDVNGPVVSFDEAVATIGDEPDKEQIRRIVRDLLTTEQLQEYNRTFERTIDPDEVLRDAAELGIGGPR